MSLPEMQVFVVAHQPQPVLSVQLKHVENEEQEEQQDLEVKIPVGQSEDFLVESTHLFCDSHQPQALVTAHSPQFVNVEQKSVQFIASTRIPSLELVVVMLIDSRSEMSRL
jgi:hypothetical protein